ncbi:MAG: beta-lactamase family protein [Kouleothrix sp.]|nr:beta-lactamase family protein [Kouleothrix sp.]
MPLPTKAPMIRPALPILFTLALLLAAAAPAGAQAPKATAGAQRHAAAAQAPGPTDPAELTAFLDGLLARELAEQHIAGAAVAVVKGGRLFFAKGYGYADIEHSTPVDAEQTLFKVGSVTKLFTWTAVMQLVEQGKLSLDADVNTYLDFHIPDTYAQPITLKHLMTHTAGFEDLHVDMVTLSAAEIAPQGTWLAAHIPARVLPPGEVPAYSNYGAALAGYIVARVAGRPYDQYVQEQILNPLGMRSSTAQWPTPPALRTHESVGYTYENNAFQVFPNLYGPVDLFPIGAVKVTATDMARFMIAHLQNGRYSDAAISEARILTEATARSMHTTLYTPDPRILGTTYGFFEFSDNGQRVIGHGGEAEPMHSTLFLLPDQNLGVFVAYNSTGAGSLTSQHLGFQRAFFDHYYPTPVVEPIQPPADFAQRADRFVGTYTSTMRAHTTFEKFVTLLGMAIDVKNPGDGTLLTVAPWGEMSFVEEAPLYFRQVNGPFHILFRADAQGHLAYLFTDFTPMFAFEKTPWYATLSFNLWLVLASLALFISMLLVAAIRAIRRRSQSDQAPAPRGARVAIALMVAISALNLLFVAGNFAWGEQLVFGVSLAYSIVLGLGVLSALLTVGALMYAVLAWKERYWGIAFRAYYTLGALAAAAFVWFLSFWRLLGWQY